MANNLVEILAGGETEKQAKRKKGDRIIAVGI